ncbi:hypothetical protein MIND_01259500 [Mycena indigotica]|uniref:Uncharacterized protein n=1 Tax=Mycena indigotica TaxID=2126181 RepID=A0A8H6S1X7_9AGAR|nr:uncharacterized protein MIND_01259500 [Mycena indigotica]KAF7291163.1 hypothetical protein MIND_01259500 [Mycena indigotica]
MAQDNFFMGWTMKKLNATVLNDIWFDVMLLTLVSTSMPLPLCPEHMLTPAIFSSGDLYHEAHVAQPHYKQCLVRGAGYRTGSCHLIQNFKYQEGRKLWTNIAIASRNLAQIIWIHVATERTETGGKTWTILQSTIEKKTMLNLVQAFSVSVKHLLRQEPGVYYDDLYPLISFLPRFASQQSGHLSKELLPLWEACEDPQYPWVESWGDRASSSEKENSEHGTQTHHPRRTKTFDPEAALADVDVHRPLGPARNPPKIGFFDCFSCNLCGKRPKSKLKGIRPLTDSNVPFEITIYLSSYISYLLGNAWILPAPASAYVTNLGLLQDALANLDRIASTPLPFAYQVHLRVSLWLYLLFLPFQVVGLLGWVTIPGTAFAAFLFLGFLEIGQEIENPFNYDLNDLNLDGFCLAIQRDLHEIAAHTNPNPAEFVFSAWNQPFAPTDRRSSEALVADATSDYSLPSSKVDQSSSTDGGSVSLQQMLVRNWREIEGRTRH